MLREFRFKRGIKKAIASSSRTPVIVYTLSKTASTSVLAALQRIPHQAAFQVHVISPSGLARIRTAARERGIGGEHTWEPIALGSTIHDCLIRPRRRAKIVTLLREPISRNISFYFEILDVLWKTERAHEHIGLDRLMREFAERFNHDRAIKWFDDEYQQVLGVDVYDHEFPRERGFLRIDSGPYEILLMHHDLNDRVKEKCMAELVGVPSIAISPRNQSIQKQYGETYRQFIERLRFPASYVDRMLDSKYARHFYSSEELARLRNKWLNNGKGDHD